MAEQASSPTKADPKADPKAANKQAGKRKRGKKVILIPAIVLVLGLGGGGYMMTASGKKSDAAHGPTTTTTLEGPIIRLAPQTFNLTDGSAVKVGIALQLVAHPHNKELESLVASESGGAHGGGSSSSDTSGSIPQSPLKGQEARALDIALLHLGDLTYDELLKKGGRIAVKDELTKEIQEAYEGDVVKVYFTEFTMSPGQR